MIALDIDGTITAKKHKLEQNVSNFLNQLAENQWQLLFLTGRTFAFTRGILSTIEAGFYLAVQNGAAIYEMPNSKLFSKNYISISHLAKIEEIVHLENLGLFLDSGSEAGDKVFYKPKEHTPLERSYIDYRISFSPEKWVPVDDFSELPLQEFALAKLFAHKEQAFAIHYKLEQQMGNTINSIVLRDPFREQGYIVHINAKDASKSSALLKIKKKLNRGGVVIAAGDDLNDESMLLASDVKIVMEGAPQQLQSIADIIAPAATKEGIIEGITGAIEGL